MRKWLLPEYIEDVLPEPARRVESLRRGMLDLFATHGYQLVIPPLLEKAREMAAAKIPALREQARAEMRALLGGELQRLRALRTINDHIRPEEVAALEQRMTDLDRVLGAAELRLDAVLLIVPA